MKKTGSTWIFIIFAEQNAFKSVLQIVKKVFSISTVILLLTAMLHISVAKHYCGGELAASKISLSGGLASCGMEDTEDSCPLDAPGDHLKSHCCDDVVTFYSFDNNYTQSQSVVSETYRLTTNVLEIPVIVPVQFSNFRSDVFTDVSPPDFQMYTAVDLTNICVFRI